MAWWSCPSGGPGGPPSPGGPPPPGGPPSPLGGPPPGYPPLPGSSISMRISSSRGSFITRGPLSGYPLWSGGLPPWFGYLPLSGGLAAF